MVVYLALQENEEPKMVRMFLIPNNDSQAMSFFDIVLPTAPK